MKLSIAEVEHIARLARLELSEKEKESYAVELTGILSYVERLQKLNLTDVSPTIHLTAELSACRTDVVNNPTGAERADLLALFPKVKGELLSVPQVFADYKE